MTSSIFQIPRQRQGTKSGQVLVIFALSLLVVVMAVGLGIDASRMYDRASHLQRAVDAAALNAVMSSYNGKGYLNAGATVVDENLAGDNINVGSEIQTTVTLPGHSPLQSVVTVTDKFPLVFGSLFGVPSVNLVRTASARQYPKIQMENPTNTLGNFDSTIPSVDPLTHKPSVVGQHMTLAINMPGENTESGDPYSSLFLAATVANPMLEYNTANANSLKGYDYKVSIPPVPTSGDQTYIQVEDPGQCLPTGVQQNSSRKFDDGQGMNHYGLPWSDINSPALGSTYYSIQRVGAGASDPLALHMTAAAPALPVVNWHEQQPSYYLNPLTTALELVTSGNQMCSLNYGPTVADWYTLAIINTPVKGISGQDTYNINVNTCPDIATCIGSGSNGFALRAVTTNASQVLVCSSIASPGTCPFGPFTTGAIVADPSPLVDQPTVSGDGQISFYASSSSNTALVSLAKIDPKYAGKWIEVRLFDPGDMMGHGAIQLIRPDGTYAPLEWNTTTFARSQNNSWLPFTTHYVNNGSTSIITAWDKPVVPLVANPPVGPTGCQYADSKTDLMNYLFDCPTTRFGAHAYAQTPEDANPFYYVANSTTVPFMSADGQNVERPGGFVDSQSSLATRVNGIAISPLTWLGQGMIKTPSMYPPTPLTTPPTASSADPTDPMNYNFISDQINNQFAYYNNRWLNIYTLIPNPAPVAVSGDYWSLQYVSSNAPTDRLTAEVAIIGEPPRIQQ